MNANKNLSTLIASLNASLHVAAAATDAKHNTGFPSPMETAHREIIQCLKLLIPWMERIGKENYQ